MHSGSLMRLWTTFVITMLLASMIPALANPVLAAPDPSDGRPEAVNQTDTDGDTILDSDDNCPNVANLDQADSDGDEVGDACDTAQPQDTDGDGINDGDEASYGTDPNQFDTDFDGLSDGEEVSQYGTDPTDLDTDRDGLDDYEEIFTYGSNPTAFDTDGDGLQDDEEIFTYETDPTNPDTDEDGVPDGQDDDPLNAQTQQRQLAANGTIQSRLLLCPPGTTTFPADETTCNLYDVASPGMFGLLPAGVQIQTGGDGYAIFTEVAPGEVTLSLVEPPMNTPLVVGSNPYCTTDQPEQGQSNTKPYAQASDSAIRFDLLSGETVNCLWFAIAQTGYDAYHTKWVCPYGYDWSGKSRDQLMMDCTRPVANVSFTVQVQTAQYEQTVEIGQGNTATFLDVPSGQYAMYENLPPEYEFLTVYCIVSTPGTNGQASYQEQQLNESNRLVGEMQGGEIRCDWFNRERPALIAILKVNCPPDWMPDSTGDLSGIRSECDPPSESVNFDVRWTGPTVQGEQTTQLQTNAQTGVAESSELAPGGEAIISEVVPEGYELKYIFCGEITPRNAEPSMRTIQSTGAFPELQDVTPQDGGTSVTRTLRPGHIVICVFVDVPLENNGTLILIKFNCPEGWMAPEGDPTLEAFRDCAPPQEPVSFNVQQGEETESLQTISADNMARTESIELLEGELTIGEVVPDGYELRYIFCRYLERGPQLTEQSMTNLAVQDGEPTFESQTVTDNGLRTAIRGGYLLACIFIDIPTGGFGDIHLYKWECDEGVTPPEGAGYDWYEENCRTPVNGVTFTVDMPEGETDLQADTGDSGMDGYISFDSVPAGTYPVMETPEDGYELLAVFCYTAPAPNSIGDPPYENYTPDEGSTIEVQLENGYVVTCHWFNMPVHDYEVTVYKWKCDPGTMPGQSLEYYQGGLPDQETGPCETSHEPGVPFTLWDANGDTPFMSGDHTGVTLPFEPNPDGSFTITEGELEGYGEPFRYCLPLNPPEDGGAPPAWQTGGMGKDITVTVVEGEYQYKCWFYNIPYENTITVYKWQCPEGTLYGQEQSYYETECEQWHLNVPMRLVDGAGMHDMMTAEGGITWNGVMIGMEGELQLIEDIPEGYSDPVVFCKLVNDEDWTTMPSLNGFVIPQPGTVPFDYECYWYNIPWQDSTVVIRKWECPEGAMPDGTPEWYQTNCTTPHNGVDFTLTDSLGPRLLTTTGGQVEWTDVQDGPVSIDESIPPGYTPQPYVVCGWTATVDGAIIDAFPMPYAPINGTLNINITYPGTFFFCDWYNQYLGDGEITVYKYECPEGYDPYAFDANPLEECDVVLNGIRFVLDQPDPEVNLQSDTGDSIDGAVYFGGLPPGDYIISEMVPAEYEQVFVWDCVGMNYSSVHPTPLEVGPDLAFQIVGGDSIECYWYNVPVPEGGWMVVKKFNCTTKTYVSDVNCYTNTTGQAFDLQAWNGATWNTVQSGTTNASGQVTFMDLEPGDYRLIEPGMTACLMKSSNITSGGNIGVAENQQTTVHVYNCSSTPPSPKTPTKYPNTGVEPGAGSGDLRTSHGASILGMLGLAGTAAVSRRTFLKRAAVGTLAVGGGAVALNGAIASQTLVPLDATVTPVGSPAGTPAVDCLYPATPSATPEGVLPGTPVACARGAVPVHIWIDSIGVDYPIEYLEILEGEMQQPTGAEYIAWYKETARLGEQGNGLYAGHLNWWNMPEGPFFLLETLVEGDVVEIEGDDGEIYRYIVQWTQDFPIDEEPPEAALGPTDEEVITLITCGGEWNAEVALYDHRTVVRAIRDRDFVPGAATPPAEGTPPSAP